MEKESRKELTIQERKLIVDLHENQNKSYSEIARMFSRSRSTIQNVIKRFKTEKRVENLPRTGRPAKLNEADKRQIKRIVQKNPFISAKKVSDELNNYAHKKVHQETIRRVIVEAGFSSRTPRKKPLVSAVNKKKRIEFAKQFLNESEEFWSNVLFSDESKYNIFSADGRLRVWRKPGEAFNPKNTIKTVKHGGGSVMVWGCMSASGVGNLVFIENTMNQHSYLQILKENMKESAAKLGLPDNFYFQQDNDPKHTAHKVRMWLLYNARMLITPPQSPDLNPIEHLWEELDQKIRKYEISGKARLKEVLLDEWNNISDEYTKKLVDSMPKRLREVLKMKGYPTRY